MRKNTIRLPGYDYSKSGFYFITIDVQDKLKLFWEDNNREGQNGDKNMGGQNGDKEIGGQNGDKNMGGQTHRSARTGELNEIGKMVDYWWCQIANHFGDIEIDEYVVMPDHFHGILKKMGGLSVGVDRCVDPKLGDIVQWFKTMTTNEYIKGIKKYNWPRFDKRLWQRNYFEEIVKNKNHLVAVREYIRNNPSKLGINNGQIENNMGQTHRSARTG